jgi:hypothetical protein
MLSVDGYSRLVHSGFRQTGREPRILFDVPMWKFRINTCEDRNGIRRAQHSYCKDNRCVFCDYLNPKC